MISPILTMPQAKLAQYYGVRADAVNDEEQDRLGGYYLNALLNNNLVFDLSLQFLARNPGSSFDKALLKETIRNSFCYLSQVDKFKQELNWDRNWRGK